LTLSPSNFSREHLLVSEPASPVIRSKKDVK
jgi:hypothetical protein